MFSLPKLIVLALVIMAVLYGFKLAGSLRSRRDARDTAPEPTPEKTRERERLEAEDLVQCPKCGAYVSAGADHECRRQA